MELKVSHKKSLVGVIPEDWAVAQLGSVTRSPVQNGVFNEPERKGRGCKLVNVGDLYAATPINTTNLERFDATPKEISKFGVAHGDLFFTRSSITPDGIAFCNVYEKSTEEVLVFDCHIIRVQTDPLRADPFFISRYAISSPARAFLVANAKTTTMTTVDQAVISSLPVPLPSIKEQRAIATALSDVDALIAGLERLIAKKRDIKQAAMQQLLTSQTRLPGFTREWERKFLPELADIRSGGTPSTNDPAAWDGDIAWCTPTDITALAGGKYLTHTARRISEHGLKQSSAEVIPARSIVMTSRATIGECAINVVPMTTNQGFKNFVPNASVDTEFLYYLLTTQKAGFVSLCGGSTFLEIGKSQLRSYSVHLPADKSEQTAIATVLSDMDAELSALQSRLTKTRAIKQGMMQELLTGRTRLLAPTKAQQ